MSQPQPSPTSPGSRREPEGAGGVVEALARATLGHPEQGHGHERGHNQPDADHGLAGLLGSPEPTSAAARLDSSRRQCRTVYG